MPITMKEVAARARTSVATVSKCLHGAPSIPPRTRDRVNEIARQMGYRLHPYLSALMRNRRKRGAADAGVCDRLSDGGRLAARGLFPGPLRRGA